MTRPIFLAIAGVGNNIAALVQGVDWYRVHTNDVTGLAAPVIGGHGVGDIAFACAYDVDPEKVLRPLREAIFAGANNHPRLADAAENAADDNPTVQRGIDDDAGDRDIDLVAEQLKRTGSNVLLLSLPAGHERACRNYAAAALRAGAAVVNCSPDKLARDPKTLARFADAGLPLLGDDLASQFGSSLLHRALLDLASIRGLTVEGSYQVNIGGNEDFRNLRQNPQAKLESKLNVLRAASGPASLTVIPSGGHIPQLGDHKIAYIRLDASGWAGAHIAIDVKLEVLDSSNAAGVIIDLVRLAATAPRPVTTGFVEGARHLLKSPPT